MKLIKLECDNPKFKPLIFNSGLNIVAGIKLSESEKKTYNGIGKSASLALVHLMLGSRIKNTNDHFIKYLSSYGIFKLTFSHLGIEYCIEKNFADDKYRLNGEDLGYSAFLLRLNAIFIPSKYNLSFRQVFNVFARRYGYYEDALTQQGMGLSDYYQRYVNLVLLGINTDLVQERFNTKERIAKLNDAKKVIVEYEKNVEEGKLADLKEQLEELINKKNSFSIAKDYDEQKKEADELTKKMNELRDETYDFDLEIRRKNTALEESVYYEIDNNKVKTIYEDANHFFPDQIYRRLDEVQEFHKSIVINRKNKLSKEIESIALKKSLVEEELAGIEKRRDNILKRIEKKGALEEYHSLMDHIKEIETQIQDIEKYKNIIKDFKIEKSNLEVADSEIKAKSIIYINDNQEMIENSQAIFRSIVKKFYTNTGGSLELLETVDAKYLYEINVQIPKDKSQGINEVKIFSYDVLLYIKNREILNFMAHDGCLFSEMDPRQKATIIKTVLQLIEKYDLQYYVNMNQNTFDEIINSKILSKKESNTISQSIILNLNDANPKGWLFGESF